MSDDFFKVVSIEDALQGFQGEHCMTLLSLENFFKILDDRSGWIEFHDWEEFSDIEIYRRMAALRQPSDIVHIISDVSYQEGRGAFLVDSKNLEKFFSSYSTIYGRCLFDGGDVFILDNRNLIIWALHHEGIYGVFDFAINHSAPT